MRCRRISVAAAVSPRPKLRPGGLLALDDASWASVRPTLEELRERLIPLLHLHDAAHIYDEQETDFAVFRLPE